MIWTATFLTPLLCSVLVLLPGIKGSAVRSLAPLAALPALWLALADPISPGESPNLILGMVLGFGPYGRLFLFPTALLWSAAGLAFAIRPTAAPSRFAFYFLLTMTGNLGLIIVQDAASFYSFFALMTYAAYGLVIHERTPEALKAGRVYLIMSLAGEGAIIAALILAVSAGETNSLANAVAALTASPWKDLALGAAALGFGVKAGAFLLHFWLPLAHPVAPTPASAVLSGCMIKAGLLGWLHFFPVHSMNQPGWGALLALFGVLAMFYGVLAGLARYRPKTILAYSSISQMGLMTMALGMGLMDARLVNLVVPALLLLVLSHALAKGALFLATGTLQKTRSNTIQSVALLGLTVLPVLVLSGFPLSSGAAAKHALKLAAKTGSLSWPVPVHLLLTVGSIGTMLLLTHFLFRVHHSMPRDGNHSQPVSWVSWVLPLLPPLVFARATIRVLSGNAPAAPHLSPESFLQEAWPVLLGAALAWTLNAICRECLPSQLLPWNMVMNLCRSCSTRVLEQLSLAARRLWGAVRIDPSRITDRITDSDSGPTLTGRLERRFMHWHTAGMTFVFLLLVFLVISIWMLNP